MPTELLDLIAIAALSELGRLAATSKHWERVTRERRGAIKTMLNHPFNLKSMDWGIASDANADAFEIMTDSDTRCMPFLHAVASLRALIHCGVWRTWSASCVSRRGAIGTTGLFCLAYALQRGGAFPELLALELHSDAIDDAGLAHLAAALGSGALRTLEQLKLPFNRIGSRGVSALSQALAVGALRALIELNLLKNDIRDEGMSILSVALENKGLPHLEELELCANSIGDRGVSAFSRALAKGAVQRLTFLGLCENAIGNDGLSSLAAAFSSETDLKLETLLLYSNVFGCDGCANFSRALFGGALARKSTSKTS